MYAQSSQVPIRGAKVWPGFVTRATIPKSSAEAACFLRFRTRSSSTRSVTTRLSNLQVPSVNTRLLQNNRQITEQGHQEMTGVGDRSEKMETKMRKEVQKPWLWEGNTASNKPCVPCSDALAQS